MAMITGILKTAALFRRNADGNVILAGVFAIAAIAVVSGMAIDYSRNTSSQADLQGALDGAVLAAASGEASTRAGTAEKHFNVAFSRYRKLVTSLGWTNNDDGSFTGKATMKQSNLLMSAFGYGTATISANATAIASNGTSVASGAGSKSCIMVVNPTATQALLINTPVAINSPNCRIDVFSQAAPAAIFNVGFTHNLSKICVKGSNVIENDGPVPALDTSCVPPSDPYAGKLPVVSASACTVNDQNYAGVNNLVPGVYCGTFNFNGTGTLNLAPGLYVLKNTRWNLNSGWTVNGSGVTFYLADENSYIQVNSGVAMHVTAPSSGIYKDLLLYEPTGLPRSAFTINGSAGHTFKGLIYLPSRDITFNSVSSITSESISMVFGTLILDHIDWKFHDTGYSGGSGGGAGVPQMVRLIR